MIVLSVNRIGTSASLNYSLLMFFSSCSVNFFLFLRMCFFQSCHNQLLVCILKLLLNTYQSLYLILLTILRPNYLIFLSFCLLGSVRRQGSSLIDGVRLRHFQIIYTDNLIRLWDRTHVQHTIAICGRVGSSETNSVSSTQGVPEVIYEVNDERFVPIRRHDS